MFVSDVDQYVYKGRSWCSAKCHTVIKRAQL